MVRGGDRGRLKEVEGREGRERAAEGERVAGESERVAGGGVAGWRCREEGGWGGSRLGGAERAERTREGVWGLNMKFAL